MILNARKNKQATSNNKILLLALLIITVVVSAVSTLTLVYRSNLENFSEQLIQSLENQKQIVKTFHQYNQQWMQDDYSLDITLAQIASVYQQLALPGSREFLLVQHNETTFLPIFYHEKDGAKKVVNLPDWFEVFEKDINKQDFGIVTKNDVLLVFEHITINEYRLLLAIKADINEVRQPFISGIWLGIFILLVTSIIAGWTFRKRFGSLFTSLERTSNINNTIFNITPQAIIVTNASGAIKQANQATLDLFNLNEDTIYKETLSNLLPEILELDDSPSILSVNLGAKKLKLKIIKSETELSDSNEKLELYILNDITEQDNNEQLVLDSIVRTSAIIDTVKDGIFTIDQHGIIQMMNPSVEKIFGYLTGELEGQNIKMLMAEPHRSNHDNYLKRYMDTGEAHIIGKTQELIAKHKAGHIFPIELTINKFMLGEDTFFTGVTRDITQRVQQQDELTAYRENLEQLVDNGTKEIKAIVETAVNAIITIDETGTIKLFNPAAEKMFGWSKNEMINQNVARVVPDIDFTLHNGFIRNYIETKKAKIVGQGREVLAKRKDGSTFPAYLSVGHNELADGHHLFVGFITDITEQRNNERELILAKDQAEAANKAKANFLANMSHEIRTPMNAIIGFSELMMMNDELDEDTTENVSTILTAGRNLLGIINDILDFSKIEANSINIEHICFELPNLIYDVIRMLEIKAQEKDLVLNHEISPLVPTKVKGDPTRLRQVLINLLGNSIKFTPRGSILLKVLDSQEPDMFLFQVIDTGIGMEPEQIDKVFNAFSQADESTNRRFGGTGLGTTISKQIIELMNGWIWVESEINQGTTFNFVVQLEPVADDTPSIDDRESLPQPNQHQTQVTYNILVAEDIAANAHLLQARLGKLGHNLTWVDNGLKALEAITEQEFDIVLMDIQMPIMDGLTATKKIRELPARKDVPIIALTASVLKEERQLCYDAGINSIVTKPIDFNELLMVIESEMVNKNPHKRPLKTKHIAEIDTEISSQSQDSVDLQELFASAQSSIDFLDGLEIWQDEAIYFNSLRDFNNSYTNIVIDIRSFIIDKDHDSLKTILHSLKGVCGNLKISFVAQLAANLEAKSSNFESEQFEELLTALEQELQNVSSIINKLPLTQEIESEQQSVEINDTGEVLQQLLKSLEALNPDQCEPWLIKLKNVLPSSDLSSIAAMIDAFRFEEARAYIEQLLANYQNDESEGK